MCMESQGYFLKITVFQGKKAPEEGILVGYSALIHGLKLTTPHPAQTSIISHKRRSYSNADWRVFSSRNIFEDTLYKHLVFALLN